MAVLIGGVLAVVTLEGGISISSSSYVFQRCAFSTSL